MCIRDSSKTLWVYAKYKGGEEELYNISKDPHHLHNLAGKPAYGKVLNDMRRFHKKVWNGDGVQYRFRLGNTPLQ